MRRVSSYQPQKFIQLTDLTIKNTEVCPAAYNIVEALKQRLPR